MAVTSESVYTPIWHNSTDAPNLLEQKCRPEWPIAVCMFANIAGLCSTTIWFLVLAPQLIHNFRRKSVRGLSVLWATANFTASLVNLFFIYKLGGMPLYSRISAIYMPVLEILLLTQFLIYGNYERRRKIVYILVCLGVWITIILMQTLMDIYQEMEWVAIALWSTETIPQIILNLKRRSTDGVSRLMVTLAMTGKTTDFLANNILLMPLQIVIMIYFSSSTAYLSGIQVAYFGHGRLTLYECWKARLSGLTLTHNENSSSSLAKPGPTTPATHVVPSLPSLPWLVFRTGVISITSVLLVAYSTVLLINTGTWLAVLAPTAIIIIITAAIIIITYYPQYSSWMTKI